MQLTLDVQLTDFDGKPLFDPKGELLTFKAVLLAAVNFVPMDNSMTLNQKLRAYKLGLEIAQADDVLEINEDGLERLRTNIGLMFNPVVIGQVFKVFDEVSAQYSN